MRVELQALDGRSPIAFMAALGVLRLLADEVRLGWVSEGGMWRPVIDLPPEAAGEDWLCRTVHARLTTGPWGGSWAPWLAWDGESPPADIVVKDTADARVENERLYRFAHGALDRETERFVAAYGTWKAGELPEFLPTGFRMRVAPKQQLLHMVRKGSQQLTEEHVKRALFTGWTYTDARAFYGWYPGQAVSHATSPVEPTLIDPMGELGAFLLAFHGLSFFPVLPARGGARTTAFHRNRDGEWRFVWPLWEPFLGEPAVRALLLECDWQGPEDLRQRQRELQARGVVALREARLVVEKTPGAPRLHFAASTPVWGAA